MTSFFIEFNDCPPAAARTSLAKRVGVEVAVNGECARSFGSWLIDASDACAWRLVEARTRSGRVLSTRFGAHNNRNFVMIECRSHCGQRWTRAGAFPLLTCLLTVRRRRHNATLLPPPSLHCTITRVFSSSFLCTCSSSSGDGNSERPNVMKSLSIAPKESKNVRRTHHAVHRRVKS